MTDCKHNFIPIATVFHAYWAEDTGNCYEFVFRCSQCWNYTQTNQYNGLLNGDIFESIGKEYDDGYYIIDIFSE